MATRIVVNEIGGDCDYRAVAPKTKEIGQRPSIARALAAELPLYRA